MKKPNKTLLARILQGGISKQQLLQRSEFFSVLLLKSNTDDLHTVDYCSDPMIGIKGDRLTSEQVEALRQKALGVYEPLKSAFITITLNQTADVE